MCLTVPKKVVAVEGNQVVVEDLTGGRQTVKSVIELVVGDYVATEQGMVSDKIDTESALSLLNIFEGNKL